MTRTLTLLLLLLALPMSALSAQDRVQPAATITQAAERYVQALAPAGAQVAADAPDARMRMPACAAPLNAASSSAAGAHRYTVAVSCAGPQAWTLYVPVKVASLAAVVVAARNLPAGSVPTAADLRLETRDTASLQQGWLGDIAQALGQPLARPLAAGAVLAPQALGRTAAVKRGQLVTLVGRAGSFEVRAQGKVLADAAAGDRVQVENSSSRRIVQGLVLSGSEVEIPL